MEYHNIRSGIFRQRPNRFIALVELDGAVQRCHVKNTGRCRELLVPGARVLLEHCPGAGRKTDYDLVAVWKGVRLINMDAQAPNRVAEEALRVGLLGTIEQLRREQRHGDSRFDFAFSRQGKPCFLEVKGVTLEENGVVRFPDAPTLRGTKHLRHLTHLAQAGCGAFLLLVVQMAEADYFTPNDATDPAFGRALRQAAQAGVHILAYTCRVTETSLQLDKAIPVRLGETKEEAQT